MVRTQALIFYLIKGQENIKAIPLDLFLAYKALLF